MMKPYIFLDRDGTINKEKNYLYKIEDFEFEDGSIEGLKVLQGKGYGLIVLTNQSGIARGYYTAEDAGRLHDYMCKTLYAEGVYIEKIYICPHGPEDNCECRKPKLGMYKAAVQDLDIDLENSYMVGDRVRDLEPAMKLKSKYAFIQTGHSAEEDITALDSKSIFKSMLDFADFVPAVQEAREE